HPPPSPSQTGTGTGIRQPTKRTPISAVSTRRTVARMSPPTAGDAHLFAPAAKTVRPRRLTAPSDRRSPSSRARRGGPSIERRRLPRNPRLAISARGARARCLGRHRMQCRQRRGGTQGQYEQPQTHPRTAYGGQKYDEDSEPSVPFKSHHISPDPTDVDVR